MTSTHPNDMTLDTNETADDLGSERLPPLRELIWRRLRRRSAQMARLEDENETILCLRRFSDLNVNRV